MKRTSRITRGLGTSLAGITLLAFVSCGPPSTRYFHPNADIAAIKKVAVLPFENLSQERTAGDKVQKVFLVELLSLELFDVVEPGQVTLQMRTQRIETTEALGPAELKRIGEALGVDGLFLGSVVDFADTTTGVTPTPEVTVQLRLVEAQSGVTIWSASETRSGATVSSRLFGIGGDSLTEAARKLVRDELQSLLK